MQDDINTYEYLTDLLYKDLLGLLNAEEKEILYTLRLKYGIKEIDVDEIINRLQGKDEFDGKKAYQEFKKSKFIPRKSFVLLRRFSIAASVILMIFVSIYLYRHDDEKNNIEKISLTEHITPGKSLALLTLADGRQIPLEKDIDELKVGNSAILRSKAGILEYKSIVDEIPDILMYNKITVPRGGEYCLKLSDGTKVWLNSDSELKYPIKFSDDSRAVYLKGEAYFQVSKSDKSNFAVHTSMGSINVLGTSFNVRDYAEERKVITTLETGKIEYISAYNNEKYVVRPGFQVREMDSGKVDVEKVDVMNYTAWHIGKYVFENETLGNIMQNLERWYDFEVVFVDESLKNNHFTGDLERYDSIDTFLNFIEVGGNVKFKIDGRMIIIDKK